MDNDEICSNHQEEIPWDKLSPDRSVSLFDVKLLRSSGILLQILLFGKHASRNWNWFGM